MLDLIKNTYNNITSCVYVKETPSEFFVSNVGEQ